MIALYGGSNPAAALRFQANQYSELLVYEFRSLFAASLVAAFASPIAFCASPFASCAAPSTLSLSEPTTLPTPCLTLPEASLARPVTLSVVLPIGISPTEVEL